MSVAKWHRNRHSWGREIAKYGARKGLEYIRKHGPGMVSNAASAARERVVEAARARFSRSAAPAGERKHNFSGAARDPLASPFRGAFSKGGSTGSGIASHKAAHFKVTNGEDVKIRRSYRSTQFPLSLTTAVNGDGFAWSLRLRTEGAAIYAGSPQNGTLSAANFTASLIPEMLLYNKLFRYMRISAIRQVVVPLPEAEFQAAAASMTVANIVRDLGQIYLLPWAGETGIANYTTGVLAAGLQPQDFDRRQRKEKFNVTSNKMKRRTLDVMPMSVESIPSEPNDSSDPVIKFVPTPAVQTLNFTAGTESLDSYGGVMYWFHPDTTAFPSGSIQIQTYYELDIEWSELALTATASTLNDPKLFGPCSRDALRADLGLPPGVTDQRTRERIQKEQENAAEIAQIDEEKKNIMQDEAILIPQLTRQQVGTPPNSPQQKPQVVNRTTLRERF